MPPQGWLPLGELAHSGSYDGRVGEKSVQGGAGPWHRALVYAVTGQRRSDLGVQPAPDLKELQRVLRSDELGELVRAHRDSGRPWPLPVPAELMAGLGYAQFAAALAQLQSALGLEAVRPSRDTTSRTRALSAGERRLLDEVPPHHGR
jgi:hypothetical protein